MPNDAKLGFVVGLAVVITVSAVFYRKAGPSVSSLAEEVKAAAVPSRKPTQPEGGQTVKARPAVRTKNELSVGAPTPAETGGRVGFTDPTADDGRTEPMGTGHD